MVSDICEEAKRYYFFFYSKNIKEVTHYSLENAYTNIINLEEYNIVVFHGLRIRTCMYKPLSFNSDGSVVTALVNSITHRLQQ